MKVSGYWWWWWYALGSLVEIDHCVNVTAYLSIAIPVIHYTIHPSHYLQSIISCQSNIQVKKTKPKLNFYISKYHTLTIRFLLSTIRIFSTKCQNIGL